MLTRPDNDTVACTLDQIRRGECHSVQVLGLMKYTSERWARYFEEEGFFVVLGVNHHAQEWAEQKWGKSDEMGKKEWVVSHNGHCYLVGDVPKMILSGNHTPHHVESALDFMQEYLSSVIQYVFKTRKPSIYLDLLYECEDGGLISRGQVVWPASRSP